MLEKDLIDVIKSRRSIRKFTKEIISDKEIFHIIDAAGYAPSNNNRQPWKFIILRSEEKKRMITDAVINKIDILKEQLKNEEIIEIIDSYKKYLLFIKDAGVLIFASYKNPPGVVMDFVNAHKEYGLKSIALNELISTSMSVENILLAAHCLGLGACCTTGPLIAEQDIKSILDIRPPFEIAAIIALGHYDYIPETPARKPVKDIIEVVK